ncbi:MAG TPA: hypothetical protein VK826_19245 [Bacteroidia bacterium]|nr:hypothetical protein [Bacteroidia bacterium]
MAKQKKTMIDAEITRDQAKKIIENYRDERYGFHWSKNQSIYAEFELEPLLKYLEKMKSAPHSATRVRLYYGAHDVEVQGRSTFCITPVIVTTKGATSPYEEIFTLNKKGEQVGLFVPIAYDFASLCPPDGTHIQRKKYSLAYDVYEDPNAKKGKKQSGIKK